ncbi:winged helix-turn-helix transcriptional regulator [Pendulispora albinea]|uniref:Winged helix-turn-helix transcriptional regulator n=1 Tax=Pendulispora albinea TaxID=2741071 RepID=A0ABZ2LWU3_9BACT
MKSYGQYCGVARGLDVIGDRWVLLIVRELLDGPRRYSELAYGLPGIATNLLAERLRTMQENGLVIGTDDDRYQLTEWGESLRGVLSAIGGWARPMMDRMAEGDVFRSHWIAHPIRDMFPGTDPARPELTIELRCGEEPMTLRSTKGRVSVHPGSATAPDLVLTGPPDAAFGLLARRIKPAEAKARGLAITGDVRLLGRLTTGLALPVRVESRAKRT